ncbi:MAG: hypothetical protein ACREIC_32825, partial [Limisphaerales bacterium]
LAAFAWITARGLTPEPNRPRTDRWLINWCLKGLLVPWGVWALMNLGLSWNLQPFMPQIQAAQRGGGSWAPAFLHVMAGGLWVMATYWTAVTLAWFVAVTSFEIDPRLREEFRMLCWTCSLALLVPAVLVAFFGGWSWFGVAAILIVAPLAAYSRGLLNRPKLPPIYARAIARIKFGKYSEAEWEIIRELENCQDDFDGWMMLADLYANHFHDLTEAERTINDICSHAEVKPSQLAVALHRLADWQLKFGQNPAAARRALLMIADRLKGTHLARMALVRMNQLPSTVEELRETQSAGTIPLPALGDHFDDEPPLAISGLERKKAARLAESCVERLRHNPDNAAVRERLARLFAEQMTRADLGIDQLRLLLGMPDQPEAKRAEWLGLTAAWEFKYRRDIDAGRRILERLVKEFPRTPQALSAKRRLEMMARKV